MPAPGAAWSTTSTLPKRMYFLDRIVGAWSFLPMVKRAPLSLYEMVVPASSLKCSQAPLVKSHSTFVPSAGSAGQPSLSKGLQSELVWALTADEAASARAAAANDLETMMDGLGYVCWCLLDYLYMR